MKMIKDKRQKFEIGRVINFTECNCKKCDFMNCPKNNYCHKFVRQKESVKEFYERYPNFDRRKSEDFGEFVSSVCNKFPKNTYWDMIGGDIYIVRPNRSSIGEDFIGLLIIAEGNYIIETDNSNQVAYKLACNILEKLKELEQLKVEKGQL